MALAAAFRFAVSEALLAEYHAALAQPSLRKLHGLTVAEVETLLTDLAQHAIILVPVDAAHAPDPGDQLPWALLAARGDLVLVTGDIRLIRDVELQGRVVPPSAFISGGQP